MWCNTVLFSPSPSLHFLFISGSFDQRPATGFWASSITPLVFPVSPFGRFWLPDQAADGTGRRPAGARAGGGSRPHRHLRCLRSMCFCFAWKRGKSRLEIRRGGWLRDGQGFMNGGKDEGILQNDNILQCSAMWIFFIQIWLAPEALNRTGKIVTISSLSLFE